MRKTKAAIILSTFVALLATTGAHAETRMVNSPELKEFAKTCFEVASGTRNPEYKSDPAALASLQMVTSMMKSLSALKSDPTLKKSERADLIARIDECKGALTWASKHA